MMSTSRRIMKSGGTWPSGRVRIETLTADIELRLKDSGGTWPSGRVRIETVAGCPRFDGLVGVAPGLRAG